MKADEMSEKDVAAHFEAGGRFVTANGMLRMVPILDEERMVVINAFGND